MNNWDNLVSSTGKIKIEDYFNNLNVECRGSILNFMNGIRAFLDYFNHKSILYHLKIIHDNTSRRAIVLGRLDNPFFKLSLEENALFYRLYLGDDSSLENLCFLQRGVNIFSRDRGFNLYVFNINNPLLDSLVPRVDVFNANENCELRVRFTDPIDDSKFYIEGNLYLGYYNHQKIEENIEALF
ncbi:MAG TPA: hypothetical protein VJB89_02400 [Candidatus Nanoarchaeia archaeon]|nr:hypothetical protein [Candidatus Nanoarchaeia archaeon]